MHRTLQVRKGVYVDSVALMQVSRQVSSLSGVTTAIVAMATDLNRELAAGMGFDVPVGAGANELLVAVAADTPDGLQGAVAEVDVALARATSPTPSAFGDAPAPVTLGAAARRSEATVALVSTPGAYAFADAVDAVDAGLLTMVFSDNVPLAQEVLLKRYADRAGVLVMGPDCGTAVVGGVGLGFANVVRPGPVGIVAASGTGAQHLMTLLDGAGVGVSHCLGVGGRDLTEKVGAVSTLRALDLLDADDATELVVVVSKPPAASVAETVRAHAEALGKPVVFGLLGEGQPDITQTAASVVRALGRDWPEPARVPGTVGQARSGGFLRGLFAGGTLCDEAMIIAAEQLGAVRSNIPLDPASALDATAASEGHTMLDLGDDRLTQGRPHPMIDGSTRVERMRTEIADPATGVILLDVVLGLGAAADPAGELAEPVREAVAAGVPVVVSLVGTDDDPQGLARQQQVLHDAGAAVFRSNAEAARAAVAMVRNVEGATA